MTSPSDDSGVTGCNPVDQPLTGNSHLDRGDSVAQDASNSSLDHSRPDELHELFQRYDRSDLIEIISLSLLELSEAQCPADGNTDIGSIGSTLQALSALCVAAR